MPLRCLLQIVDWISRRIRQKESLARSPNRYNSLSGAARAAEREGDAKAAERYRQEVVALAGEVR